MTYPLWTYIVAILCIGEMVLGHLFLFYEIYKGITETDDNIKYTVRNGIGNTWEEEDFGFWIRW